MINLGSIIPMLGKAITGNIGGAVEEGLKAIGIKPTDDPKQNRNMFEKAKENLSPDQIAALKKAEIDWNIKCKELEVDMEEVLAGDRDSARQREMTLKDKTPQIIGTILMIGFFGLLTAMMFFDVPTENQQVLHMMLGALATMTTAVCNYYFGSSRSSSLKDEKIAKMKY